MFSYILSKKWYLAATLIAGVIVIISLYYVQTRSAAGFVEAYIAYAELAEMHDTAAYIPAVPDNPIRRELNRILSEILIREDLNAGERLALARQGLSVLEEAEEQIDAIGAIEPDVTAALEGMEEAANGIGTLHTKEEGAIIDLAKKRLAIIADIRGLSYRANHHTAEIFKRVIKDKGVLTEAHITRLNDQIPRAEEQFDKRAGFYVDLENTGHLMTTAMTKYGADF